MWNRLIDVRYWCKVGLKTEKFWQNRVRVHDGRVRNDRVRDDRVWDGRVRDGHLWFTWTIQPILKLPASITASPRTESSPPLSVGISFWSRSKHIFMDLRFFKIVNWNPSKIWGLNILMSIIIKKLLNILSCYSRK